jgi:tetratricopeptide (TPR) repeat protein
MATTLPTLAALYEQAVQAYFRQDLAAAERGCQAMLEREPAHFDALNLLGVINARTGRTDQAIELLQRAAAARPDQAAAHSNLANALTDGGRPAEAVAACDRAIELKPDHAEAWYNRGNALVACGRPAQALASYERALLHKPDYAEAHSNRGLMLHELSRFDEALASYDRSLAIRPDYAEAVWNKALTLLLRSDWERGWPLYEWRWRHPKTRLHARNFSQPVWLGQISVVGKTVLLHSEQGFGDAIQFCRYAEWLADLGARVLLEVPRPLLGLMARLRGPAQVIATGEALPAFDLHCPMMSLPLAFRTTVATLPFARGYLTSDPGRAAYWKAELRDRVAPGTRRRIGIAWSGSAAYGRDALRSLAFDQFSQALPRGDIAYFALQKDIRDSDRGALAARPDVHLLGEDFAETAAIIDGLDAVVSTDTSIAHLAGALGKPVSILLSRVPDWRWLLERDDSPWYASARLCRQAIAGDWGPVLAGVRELLAGPGNVGR